MSNDLLYGPSELFVLCVYNIMHYFAQEYYVNDWEQRIGEPFHMVMKTHGDEGRIFQFMMFLFQRYKDLKVMRVIQEETVMMVSQVCQGNEATMACPVCLV